jgi:hypothetical protein
MTNPPHRYRQGDQVIFHAPLALQEFAGAYVVEKALPISADGLTYLIEKDGHERVVPERELAPVAVPAAGRAQRGTRRSTRPS